MDVKCQPIAFMEMDVHLDYALDGGTHIKRKTI